MLTPTTFQQASAEAVHVRCRSLLDSKVSCFRRPTPYPGRPGDWLNVLQPMGFDTRRLRDMSEVPNERNSGEGLGGKPMNHAAAGLIPAQSRSGRPYG